MQALKSSREYIFFQVHIDYLYEIIHLLGLEEIFTYNRKLISCRMNFQAKMELAYKIIEEQSFLC